MWSFDVFDTCLTRVQAAPSDLFLDLAHRLRADLEPALGGDFAQVFREARVESERLALVRSGAEEVTLEMVWQVVVELLPCLDAARGSAAELELEAQSLRRVESAWQRVQLARQRFGRAVFISDTYLPAQFVSAQLRKHGFLQDGDFCFVSSEYGATKRTGRLFAEVLRALKLPSGALLHHGDNPVSDVAQVRRAGMAAEVLRDALLSDHERRLARLLKSVDERSSSHLLGGMRAARVAHVPAQASPATALTEGFVGPFLWVFADWLITRASSDRINRLYFFARDCCALQRVAQVLVQRRGLKIECRYLKVSRQALLLPAAHEVSEKGMPWLRRPWEKAVLGRLLNKLELTGDAALAHFSALSGPQGADFELKSESDWKTFWDLLAAEPLRTQLLATIAERRALALRYFRQEGFFEGVAYGLVDLGWHQSCQAALSSMLRREDPAADPMAYYLALVDERGQYMARARAQALFHRAPHDRRAIASQSVLFSAIPMLEHVLNGAPHGSTRGYAQGDDGTSISAETMPVSADEREAKAALLQAVEVFASTAVAPLGASDADSRNMASVLLTLALERPEPAWAAAVARISVSDDQNSADCNALFRVPTWRQLWRDFATGRAENGLPTAGGHWSALGLTQATALVRRGYVAVSWLSRLRRLVRRPV